MTRFVVGSTKRSSVGRKGAGSASGSPPPGPGRRLTLRRLGPVALPLEEDRDQSHPSDDQRPDAGHGARAACRNDQQPDDEQERAGERAEQDPNGREPPGFPLRDPRYSVWGWGAAASATTITAVP